jgi:hypothetical protein
MKNANRRKFFIVSSISLALSTSLGVAQTNEAPVSYGEIAGKNFKKLKSKRQDIDGDGVPNRRDRDVDGDGIPNDRDRNIDGGVCRKGKFKGLYVGDRFPNKSKRELDIDGDSLKDDSILEDDIDGDGLADDAIPENDIDGDGLADDSLDEKDIDGDGLDDDADAELDIDGDGLADDSPDEKNIDGDGLDDDADEELDIDGDGQLDLSDEENDVDGDGVIDDNDENIDGDELINSVDLTAGFILDAVNIEGDLLIEKLPEVINSTAVSSYIWFSNGLHPQEALRLLGSLVERFPEDARAVSQSGLVERWSATDPLATSEWAQLLVERDDAKLELVAQLVAAEPTERLEWLESKKRANTDLEERGTSEWLERLKKQLSETPKEEKSDSDASLIEQAAP